MNVALILFAITYFTHVKPIGGFAAFDYACWISSDSNFNTKIVHRMMPGLLLWRKSFYYL